VCEYLFFVFFTYLLEFSVHAHDIARAVDTEGRALIGVDGALISLPPAVRDGGSSNHLDVQLSLSLRVGGIVGSNDVVGGASLDVLVDSLSILGQVIRSVVLALELDDTLRGVDGGSGQHSARSLGDLVQVVPSLRHKSIVVGGVGAINLQVRDGEGGQTSDHVDQLGNSVRDGVSSELAHDLRLSLPASFQGNTKAS
jgi:hypothetical protein